jgi:phosphate-selective porin OprO and OprP
MLRNVSLAGILSAALIGIVGPPVPLVQAQQVAPTGGPAVNGEAPEPDSVAGDPEAPGPQEPVRSPEVIRTENFTMTLGSRLQLRYAFMNPDEGDSNGTFGIRRGRLSMGGSAYQHFRYAMQLELSGGSVSIIDAHISYQMAPMATLWVGQGKAHFGRQQLNSSGNQNFVDRTIVDGRFSAGRQAGAALVGRSEAQSFEYGLGVYNGTGINTANDNNKYMVVGRAVWTPLGAYSPVEGAFDYPDSPRIALGVAGLATTIGAGEARADVTRLNVESAFKLRGFNATGELYWEESDPAGGEKLNTTGWYAQAGLLLPNRRIEIALRYAVISPDADIDGDVIETGVAFSHYFHEHRAKLQADVRNVERRLLGTDDVELRLQIQLTL